MSGTQDSLLLKLKNKGENDVHKTKYEKNMSKRKMYKVRAKAMCCELFSLAWPCLNVLFVLFGDQRYLQILITSTYLMEHEK